MSSAAEHARLQGNDAFKDNNLPLALAHYSTAIQRDPSVSTYFLNRSLVHLKLDHLSEAARDASTALDLDGGVNPKALFRRALARKAQGNLDGARQDFELAKQQGAGDAVDRELADLLKVLQGDPNATRPQPAKPPSPSPSADRLRAALSPKPPPTPPPPRAPPAEADGFLRAVSTRRITPPVPTPAPSTTPIPAPAPVPAPSATSLEQHLLLTQPHDPSRLALLRALDPDPNALAAFMGDSLTPDLLGAILAELAPRFPFSSEGGEKEQAQERDTDWVVPLLRGLSRCRRFDSTVLFLDERERDVVRRVLGEAEKGLERTRNAWGL
ncbi:SPOSA6832_02703 [Sporobolomyces salmonicolor]|uniref:RNA polymerase II-associated protein 3 n=1 Tax=Sporidiobolus salmonicolor TaxID=5005 RepID=A0A0D6EM11_SPOSA|nr:SPOSA6832_02703 [Sporobolomyces salmonicolor]